MVMFTFDLTFFGESVNADSDPEAAAQALLVIARRLREGKQLKPDIVEFLAGAIESAMAKPQKHRGAALLRELKLTSGNRRPSRANQFEMCKEFEALVSCGHSQNSAAFEMSDRFNISQSTAIRIWKDYLANQEEIGAQEPEC